MDRVRGGVFSGAMVLAGISATLLSALLAIGIRQATVRPNHPVQVTMVPASGEVAVPDAAATAAPLHAAASPSSVPAYARVPHGYQPPAADARTTTAQTTTGARTAGGSVTKPASAPAPAPAPTTTSTPPASSAPSATPTPSPTPTSSPSGHGHANGAGNGAGNGNGNGHTH